MIETAVATGRPVNQVLGAFKIGYAALSLFAVYALLRASGGDVPTPGPRCRWRAGPERSRWSPEDSRSPQEHDPNTPESTAGSSYPVSTWTAAFSIFGAVALDAVARAPGRGPGWVVAAPAALLLTPIGVASNYRYEPTFPALPLTLLALVLLPVSDLEHRAAGRRAKWLLGSAYGVGFGAVLRVNRMMLSDVCDGRRLLQRRQPLARAHRCSGPSRSMWSRASRGIGREQVLALLKESIPTDGLWTPTVWSVLTALALVATLASAGMAVALVRPSPPYRRRGKHKLCCA